jgi:hypothetical protein
LAVVRFHILKILLNGRLSMKFSMKTKYSQVSILQDNRKESAGQYPGSNDLKKRIMRENPLSNRKTS